MRLSKALPLALCGCFFALASFAQTWSVHITKEEYGEKWPFTVPAGTLTCETLLINGKPRSIGGSLLGIVTFHTHNKTYAMNGLADARAASRGYRPLEEIWRANPDIARQYKEARIKPPDIIRVDFSSILKRGLALCR